jgi:hypothetical protein
MSEWQHVQLIAEYIEDQRQLHDDPDSEIRRIVLSASEVEIGRWCNRFNEHGSWVSEGFLFDGDPQPLTREEWVGVAKHEMGKLRKTEVVVSCVEDPPAWWLAFAHGGRFKFEQGRLKRNGTVVSMGIFVLDGFLRDVLQLSGWAGEDLLEMQVYCDEAADRGDDRHQVIDALIEQQIDGHDNVRCLWKERPTCRIST